MDTEHRFKRIELYIFFIVIMFLINVVAVCMISSELSNKQDIIQNQKINQNLVISNDTLWNLISTDTTIVCRSVGKSKIITSYYAEKH